MPRPRCALARVAGLVGLVPDAVGGALVLDDVLRRGRGSAGARTKAAAASASEPAAVRARSLAKGHVLASWHLVFAPWCGVAKCTESTRPARRPPGSTGPPRMGAARRRPDDRAPAPARPPPCAAAATPPASPSRPPRTLPDVPGIIGQERAEEAVRFAIGIRRYGYNLYALGTSGHGQARLRARLPRAAGRRRRRRPPTGATSTTSPTRAGRASLRLPPGRGAAAARGPAAPRRRAARRHPRRLRERGLPRPARSCSRPSSASTASRRSPRSRRRARERGVAILKTPAGRRPRPAAQRRGDRARGVPAAPRAPSRSASRPRWRRCRREMQEAIGRPAPRGPQAPRASCASSTGW